MNKDTIFNFDQNCIDEFNHIKDHLSSDQVLKPIDGNKPFYIYSDASYQGIGAGIFQPYNGKLYPVGYVSKSLTPAQRRYTVMEIEIYAIYVALKEYQHFIGTQTIKVFSDNISAVYLKGLSLGTAREKRMAQFLMRFNLEIAHIPGRLNQLSDGLSRSFEDMPPSVKVDFLPQPDDEIMAMSVKVENSFVDANDLFTKTNNGPHKYYAVSFGKNPCHENKNSECMTADVSNLVPVHSHSDSSLLVTSADELQFLDS